MRTSARHLVAAAAALAVAVAVPLVASASDEAPDPTFGTAGLAPFTYPTADPGDGDELLSTRTVKIAVDAQGRTVVASALYDPTRAGIDRAVDGSRLRLEVRRLTTTGALDTTFGDAGTVSVDITALSQPNVQADLLTLGPDATIWVAVSAPDSSIEGRDAAIIKLGPDGQRDLAYTGNDLQDGWSYLSLNSGNNCQPVQPVVTSLLFTSRTPLTKERVAQAPIPSVEPLVRDRCLSAGSGNDAYAHSFAQADGAQLPLQQGTDVLLAPDGPGSRFALLASSTQLVNGAPRFVAAFRVDPTEGRRVAIDAPYVPGEVVVAAFAPTPAGYALDTTFGEDAAQHVTHISTPIGAGLLALTTAADQKLGLARPPQQQPQIQQMRGLETELDAFRLTATGLPDTDFSGDGTASVAESETSAQGISAAFTADGALITSTTFAPKTEIRRFDAAGTPDTTFGNGGSVILPPTTDPPTTLSGTDLATFGQLIYVGGITGSAFRAARALDAGASVTRLAPPKKDTAPPPPPPPPPPAAAAAQPQANVLAATRSCVSRRHFTIRVRTLGLRAIKSVSVRFEGKALKVKRVNGRYSTKVNLKTKPRKTFTLTARITFSNGRKPLVDKRVYHTCRPPSESKKNELSGRA